MKLPPADDSDSGTASDAMRAALNQQLDAAGRSSAFDSPPVIPDHTLLHRIGRGAYGDVWLARNALGTLRAVKVVYRAHFEDDRPYEREFKGILNYEPISRTHEGLVQVLHVGRNDAAGCFYYVMEVADAAGQMPEPGTPDTYRPRTLRSELAGRPRLPAVGAAHLVLRLTGALGHLHSHGLVHRDVKPSNVIFVGGQPKLADIGLVTSAGSSHTFVGTEGFIPPEGPGTPQADLYGLGKLLYELTTGRDRMDFPLLPPDVARLPERDAILELNEVVTRACAPQTEHRYASAAELQADLNLFLAGRSLRRLRNFERHVALLKRTATVACAGLVVAAVIIWFALNEQRRANERAQVEAALRGRAEQAEREREGQLYTALLGEARATVRSGELGQRVKALDAVRRAAAISNSAALRGVALAAHALPDLRFERELSYGSDFTVRQVAPSFERIALCRGRGPVEIRSISDQQLLATLPASTNLPTYGAEWSPDGRFLAIKRDYPPGGASSDKVVWDVGAARQLLSLSDAPFSGLSFHPRLPRVLVGRTNGAAVWDLEQRSELGRIVLNQTPLFLRFSPDGERFAASVAGNRTWGVSIHQTVSGELVCSNAFDAFVASFGWHPSGRWIAVPDHSGSIHRMDAQTGDKRLLGRHKAQATQVDFSPDGAYLITGGWERELICWDARTLQRSFNIGLNGYVGTFASDGRAYALETKTAVQLHAFERAGGHREFAEDLGPRLLYAAFSVGSRWLAAAGTERIAVWDLENGGPGALATSTGETRVSFAANGDLFADHLGGGFRWRVSPGANVTSPPELSPLELELPERFASLCLVSNTVVLTGARGSAVVGPGELGTGPRAWQPTVWGYNGTSPDGRWLSVFRPYTPQLFVHRLPDLKRVAILTNASIVRTFQFSPAGDELAVSCRSHVEFWSTATWQRTRASAEFNNQLYSADCRTMWLTQEFRAGGLHDARTLELLMPLPLGTYPLAVSPDGRRLAVSVDLRRLQVWDLVEVRQQLRELGLDWAERSNQ